MKDFDTCPACEHEISALHPMGGGYRSCNMCNALYDSTGREIFDMDSLPEDVFDNYNQFCEGW